MGMKMAYFHNSDVGQLKDPAAPSAVFSGADKTATKRDPLARGSLHSRIVEPWAWLYLARSGMYSFMAGITSWPSRSMLRMAVSWDI